MVEKMRTISPKAGEKFISTAMRLKMEGRLEGRMEGRMEGKLEGIEKGVKKVAFSMMQENIPDEIILKVTKLTQKELDYLKTLKEFQLDLETV
jgi:predicted transposase YdaD